MFRLDRWTIDPMSRDVTDGTSKTRLSPKALGVLMALDGADGQVVSRAALLDSVWAGVTVGEEVLTHAIAELRRAFKDSARDSKLVETVHRAGYRLRVRSEPVIEAAAEMSEPQVSEPPAPESPASEPPRAEIKQVTILMVDLGPAVANLATRGPEVAERTFDALAEQTAAVARRFGGTVTDRLNDLMVVAFGAPVSIEDPAPRAAAAALALLKIDVGDPPRVALSSGEVVQRPAAGDGPPALSGLPLSVAAEILAATPPGCVRLDAATRRLSADAIAVRALPPEVAASLTGNEPLYELRGLVRESAGVGRVAGRGLSRYVSRRLEMELLRESAEQARAGRGRIVAISGEAGIGKSRLFREFLAELPADEWLILKAAAPRGEAAPFRGAARLLSDYLGVSAHDDPTVTKSKLMECLERLGDTEDLVAPLATLLFLPVDDERFLALTPGRRLDRIEHALRRLLALEASRQPVVLVVDDLHWADPRSESALNALLKTVSSIRLLALLNYRPEYTPAFLGYPAVTQRRLDALSTEAEIELLDGLIGSSPALDGVRKAVVERARGNPLFVEEIVSSLVESGVLEGPGGARRPGRTPLDGDHRVPATIKEILGTRIDRLRPDEKELLRLCAAIGPEARRGLVAAVADLDDEQLDSTLERLQTADLLRQDPLAPQGRILFKHAMTHEVARAGLHSDDRRELHRRIAEAMEAEASGIEDAPRLAEHWTFAGAPARAIPYWQQTGRAAAFRAANRSAVRYFEAALALIPEVPESIDRQWRELELLLALGVALVAAQGLGSTRAREVYAQAETLAGRLGAGREKFIAQWGLHYNSETRESFPQAVELTYRMTQTAREAGDPTLSLQADHASWATRFAQGRLDDVLRLTDRAAALYEQCSDRGNAAQFAGHDPLACAISHSALAACIKGDEDTALTRAHQALDHARRVEHPTSIAHAVMFLAKLRFLRDEPEPLSELCDRLSRLADEHGYIDHADVAAFLGAWADWRRFGKAKSEGALDRALTAADRLIKTTAEVLLVPAAAEMRAAAGDVDGSLARIRQALAVSEKKGVALVDAELHRLAARITRDDPDARSHHLKKALEVAEYQQAALFAARTRRDMDLVELSDKP